MILPGRITAFLLGAFFLLITARAQQPHYQEQTNYSPLTNIKQVTGIASDKNNCIWLATQAGVYRYDGQRFRHYNVLNTPELKFERIFEIFTTYSEHGYGWGMRDFKGNNYKVDSLSRIIAFDKVSASREIPVHSQYDYPALQNTQPSGINESIAPNIREIFITASNQRVFLHLTTGTIRSMSSGDFFNSKKGDSLYTIASGKGNKTFGTEKNFYVIAPGKIMGWTGDNKQPAQVLLSGDILTPVQKNIQHDSLQFYPTTDRRVILLGYKGCIYEAKETNNGQTLHTRLLIRDPFKKLPTVVYYSESQRIILSYFPERGLIIYRPSRFTLLTWNGPDGTTPSLDYYYSLLPNGDGLITVNSTGIMRFGINGEKKVLLAGDFSRFFFFRDRTGNLWYDGNLQISYLPPGKGKSIHVLPILKGTGFCGAHQYDDSTYYILTSRQLYKLVRKPGNLFSRELLVDAKNTTEEFNVLYPLEKDIFWIGSDQGLREYNIRSNISTTVPELKNAYVRSVIWLEKDNYLIGTYDKGIFQWFDKKWKQLPSAKDRLPSSAHGFVVDSLTRSLWISSNEGLSRIPLAMLLRNKTGTNSRISFINNFGPDISPEFNGSSNISAVRLSDTCLAFANAKGLVIFNPKKLTPAPLPVNVLVESPEEESNSDIKIKKSNQFTFTPVVPYYGDAGDLEIFYRLTGTDKDWHSLSDNSIISYNDLKPGTHDLQFRVSNHDARLVPETIFSSVRIVVPARWYQTILFKIAAGLIAILLIVLLHNIRIWYLRKRKKELEQLIKTKTSELEVTNQQLSMAVDELRMSEADLKQSNHLKDEYYAVLTHDLRSPLKFLSFNISQLLDMLPETESEKMKKGLVIAYECTNDVYKLVDEFVYWIQNNENLLEPRALPANVYAITGDIKKLYGFSFEGNKNQLNNEVSPDLRFTTDPQMLFIILRNAIDNANKYTSGGTITVTAQQQDGNLHLAIADNGVGIREETARHLVQLQFEDAPLSYKQRRSLGFYIMAMLIKKLRGNYTIDSKPGSGTVLSFVIPESKEDQPLT